MPHYRDGTQALVGDHVIGKLYNTEHVVAGTIISITPGVDACNCMVQFTEVTKKVSLDEAALQPRMARIGHGWPPRTILGEGHGSSGEEHLLYECVDYSATTDLTLVGRAASKPGV